MRFKKDLGKFLCCLLVFLVLIETSWSASDHGRVVDNISSDTENDMFQLENQNKHLETLQSMENEIELAQNSDSSKAIKRSSNKVHALGMQSGYIHNSQITASSSAGSSYSPFLARLHTKSRGSYAGSWAARYNDKHQWIQVKFKSPKKVFAVATQGRYDYNQWVTKYTVSYSLDGAHFVAYKQHGKTLIFTGNRDRHTVVRRNFRPIIIATHVRIHPVSWYGHISMRFELYGRNARFDSIPFGLEDGRIPDCSFLSSSYSDYNHRASNARLNAVRRGHRRGAWSSKYNRRGQWIQLDVGSLARVTGVAIQGRQDANQWVKSFYMTYSEDGRQYMRYRGTGGNVLTFKGNSDRNTVVFKKLPTAILAARYIRIYPQSWYGHMSLRMELYGERYDQNARSHALGMQSGLIQNSQITASSSWDQYHATSRARLHISAGGGYQGAWSARYNNRYQWIQVQFKYPKKVTAVATQGRTNHNQWVTKYTVSYSLDGVNFATYKQRGKTVVFTGNRDRSTVVHHKLRPAIVATHVRIHPVSWYGHISMRLELYGRNARPSQLPLGIEDGRIPDRAIISSSDYTYNHRASNARLNAVPHNGRTGGWSSKYNSRGQWIQVDMGSLASVTGISIQGRPETSQWVSSYYIKYGEDGRQFKAYHLNGKTLIFKGSRDRNTVAFQRLPSVISARYIRIYPLSWYGHMSLRMELYGKLQRPSPVPVGIENGHLADKYITASSQRDAYHAPRLARLNRKAKGSYKGGWSARYNNKDQWIQFDLRRPMRIYKVVTQGRQDSKQWVKTFKVAISQDGRHWVYYKRNSKAITFQANIDQETVQENIIRPTTIARFVRIYPTSWHSHISMRAELYAAPVGNDMVPLGIEDHEIPDCSFTASSQHTKDYAPSRARLNTVQQGSPRGSWATRSNVRGQWIQVDLGKQTVITEILTQGRQDYNQWVKTYTVSYSNDGVRFASYKANGSVRIFAGNFDRNTIVVRKLRPSIQARYLRIHPQTWYGHISMRFGLRGNRTKLLTTNIIR